MVDRVRLGVIASRNGQPEDVVIGIVGDGFGALLTYTTAVYLGFRPEQIGIFGENHEPGSDLPAVRLEPRADRAALRVGVALPAGRLADLRADRRLGALAAWRRCCAPPGASSTPACRRSSPRRAVVGQRARLRAARRWADVKIGWIVREPGPPAHFSLYDDDANLLGRCKHVLIAIGPRAAGLPGRLRQGAREPGDGGPRGPGLRAQGVPRGRPLHRGRLGHRRRQRVGQLRRRRAPSASRSAATRIPTSRT